MADGKQNGKNGNRVGLLERVKADLEQVGLVEQFPKLEGRQMVMVLAPKKKGVPAKAKPKDAKGAGEAKESKDAKAKKEASPKPAAAT